MNTLFAPPTDEKELLTRAHALDGLTAGQLAKRLGVTLATDSTRGKGQVGALVEQALGASAGNLDLPDFPKLGVELKTISLDRLGRVRETTFVCTLEYSAVDRETWETSRVLRKLACVLWVPVEALPGRPPAQRRIGTPRLWRPSPAQLEILRADWHQLVGRLASGDVESVSGHLGQALQLRPKAPNAKTKVEVLGPEGESLWVVPQGFYLRSWFTEAILWS